MDALERVPLWRSFAVRVFAVPVLAAIALVTLSTAWLHADATDVVVDRFGQALESTAATAAPFIHASDVQAVQGPEDATSPAFLRLRDTLERIREENNLEEDQVYILRRLDGDELAFVAMLQPRTFIGDKYKPPPALVRQYDWVMHQGDAVRTGLYTSPNGTYISGIAPIQDDAGRVIGVLHVDFGVDQVLAEVAERTELFAMGGLGVVLIIVVIGLGVHLWVRRRVRVLLDGTAAIQNERYDHDLPVLGDDELSAVAAAFNSALVKLRERFEMLKFLPSHTTKMIAAASGPIDLFKSRSVRVVILESDIRSFTRMTAQMSPDQVIAMLNVCMSAQAGQVTAHGGSIDKFMGDALLAVFEGDGMETRALACARAIQASLSEMNDRGVFAHPVRVGVGLSVGDVVMGNMGSADRMEHTVIGTAVNLAARLASDARGGEIVMTAVLAATLPADERAQLREPELLSIKGFTEPVPCHRIHAADPPAGSPSA